MKALIINACVMHHGPAGQIVLYKCPPTDMKRRRHKPVLEIDFNSITTQSKLLYLKQVPSHGMIKNHDY